MAKVLFRADSSSSIGLGHIKRDLVYASRLNNDDIYFASQCLDGNINSEIPYPLYTIQTSNIDELIKLCNKYKIEHLIIDNYEISYEDEKKIKEKCPLFLSVFDDTYERHYCDEIINHNIGSEIQKYKKILPDFIKISLIEPLIREEFKKIKLRDRSIKRNGNKDILICMGGVDSTNITPLIIDTCQKLNNINLHIITTSINKNLTQLKEQITNINNIVLHVDTDKMAELMNESDLAIITPSVIVHEVIFMKLPFICIKTASNQEDIYQYLHKEGLNILKSFNKNLLYSILQKELR